MRKYYISQGFCITLCVGITFRNVYYIMHFNTRGCHYCDLQAWRPAELMLQQRPERKADSLSG